MNALDLFPGIGCTMLAGLIHEIQPIGAVEWDAYRCAVLRERAAEGWFPQLEIHEQDIRTFDATPYAGRVDLVRAGWPCQGISRIGKRRGLADERSGLWSEVVRVLGVVRPEHAFLENGPDIVDLCLDVVLADLARLGYDARWGIVAAANAGASHGRPRWFCVAHRVRDGLEGVCGGGQRRGQLSEAVALAYADPAGFGGKPSPRIRPRDHDYWYDADGCLSNPPWRGDGPGWQEALAHGAPEPGIFRLADAAAWRLVKAQIAAIGDGQDVIAAALAWRLLGGPVAA
jgi:DNA (cytosine-5)-methyltransferase 1